MIECSDRDSSRYVHSPAGLDWFDPRNYHLAIYTSKVDFARTEGMMVLLVSCARKWSILLGE
jgi:hypothetical protein